MGHGNEGLSQLLSTKEAEFGLPQGYLAKTAQIESSGNPNARNPNSSAGGLFQFIDSTAREYGLSNKFDPVASTDAAARLAADNKQILTGALGRNPTAGELYLAHQQGAGGAVKLLRNPNAPVEQLVGPEAARLNGGAGLTAAQFAQKWTGKIDGQGEQMAQADAMPSSGQPQPATRQNVNGQMIRTLLANPETRQMGMALWQQAQTGRQFGFQVVGDQLYRTNPATGQVEPVAGVQKPIPPVAVSEGQTLVDPRSGQVVFQGQPKKSEGAAYEERRAQAARSGLQEGDPGFQSFVLTGKMPREDAQPLSATDKKAIMEADDGVMAAQTAIQSLERAKQLSANAYDGPFAGKRGYIASLAGREAGSNTVQLENEVITNALSQLKSIFGAAPTEGERKLLLDIQGSASLPHADRVKIYDRASALAQRRLQFNQQRASEMRGGSYYKPGQKQGAVPEAPALSRDDLMAEARRRGLIK